MSLVSDLIAALTDPNVTGSLKACLGVDELLNGQNDIKNHLIVKQLV